MRWFRTNEAGAFNPFAIYCALAGLGSIAFLMFVR
jgi:hypothetical protein